MEQIYQLFIGVIVLALGIPIGNMLAESTKEELCRLRKWLNLMVVSCLLAALVFLLVGNDVILFTLLFMAIVISRCIKK